MSRFDGKVALVTGGNGGIGLAICRRFASEGASVVAVDLQQKDEVANEIEKAGAPGALSVACDVSSEEQVERAVEQTMNRFGRLDALVNNAGIMVFKPIEEQTADDWMRVLHVDLIGAFLMTRAAFRTMKPGGAIVNISSIHAVETTPLVAPYAAAKAALVSLSRSAAIEGGAKGIRVNTVLPGAIDTPMLWHNPNLRSGVEKVDPRDVGKPEDVAAVVAFLASDEAEFVKGASVRVDGGRLDHL